MFFQEKDLTQKQKKSVIINHLKSKNIKFFKNLKIDVSSTQLRNKIINGSKKIKKVIENTLIKIKQITYNYYDLKKKSYIADYMIIASGTFI